MGYSETQTRILEATQHVLAEEGDAGASMRKIAQRAGMSIGNVQYHFPTRSDVLAAFVELHFAACYDELTAGVEGLSAQEVEARARHVVALVLSHTLREDDVCRIFRELWALSARDPKLKAALDSYYQRFSTAMVDAIADPDASAVQRARLQALLLPHLEGCAVTIGALALDEAGITDLLVDLALDVLER